MALHLACDLIGNRALVQRIRPFLGDALEHRGQSRVFQQRAGGFWRAIGIQEVRRHVGRLRDKAVSRDQTVQAWGNGEALLRQANRRFKQLGPWQAAALLVRHLQGAQYPWSAHRAPANLRIRERHRRTVGLQEKTLRGPGRRSFAAVISLHVVPIPQHDERTAADAGRLRFHQGQYRLHGNRRING